MAKELAYVLIDPYTISKSRTGGVIGRYLARTDLDLVALRVFGPSGELIKRYSELVRSADPIDTTSSNLLADYIKTSCGPDASGQPRRMLMLLFEGENAVEKVWRATGSATLRWGSGESIRDTYGDYIVNDDGVVRYFEPAVLVAPNPKRAAATLRLWCEYTEKDGGVIRTATDLPSGNGGETTLVLLKPDNFKSHSSRPGSIVDILSSSGLRIIGGKKFSMTVAQAEEFYKPIKNVLREKLKDSAIKRSGDALVREFGFDVPDDLKIVLGERLSQLLMEREFENIVEFMTGHRPSACAGMDKTQVSGEECLALLYHGPNAVSKIRALLGATDPAKAQQGSVRREYGSSIMVNAAHASDSAENAVREMRIINIEQDTIRHWIEKYYPS